ncbi:MAG: iron-sulfur cluster assembly accessory protein [Dehalococcoidia bacterium]
MVIENSTLLTVSEAASSKFKEVLAEQDADDGLIRISLAPGQMGGVEYILGLEEAPEENDTLVEYFGVKIVVDAESTPLLQGSSIDYVDGLQRSGFVINNPNFASAGGCGGGGACGCGGGEPQQDPHGQAGGCACGGGGGGGCGGGGGGCGCGGGGHAH